MSWRDRRPHFEEDPEAYPDDVRYTVKDHGGVAWRVYGWEIEPDEDTEWGGYEVRTGRLVCVMVGDDARFTFDPADVTAIDELAYCAECGQIGCTADGRDRSEADDDTADYDDIPNGCSECARSFGPNYRGKCEHGAEVQS